jgi:hypothetical protein
VVRYTPLRPFVERINDTGDPILAKPPQATAPTDEPAEPAVPAGDHAPDHSSDAVPGGVTH